MRPPTTTGDEIIDSFESGAVDSFHHADHVRLAFAYLSRYPVLTAVERFSEALKRFAAAQGKSQLYHATITFAYIFLIHERRALHPGDDWQEFIRRNPDLLQWKNGILGRYYRDETLQSDLARRVFVLPDRALADRAGAPPPQAP